MNYALIRYPIIDYEKTRARIRILLKTHNLSPKDIQTFMNLTTVQTVYKWFYPDGSLPCIDHFYALSVLLGVTINDIIVEKDLESQENNQNKLPCKNIHPKS